MAKCVIYLPNLNRIVMTERVSTEYPLATIETQVIGNYENAVFLWHYVDGFWGDNPKDVVEILLQTKDKPENWISYPGHIDRLLSKYPKMIRARIYDNIGRELKAD